MKKTLLGIALAVGTTMFAAQATQTTPAPDTSAPAKTAKTAKARKHAKKHTAKKATEGNTALPTAPKK